MQERASGFAWDRGNLEKCQKHGVSSDEIEALLRSARVASRPIGSTPSARTG